ncbi:MAG TPA: hypothetical protein PKM73_13845 [Verrucomicrobiota bacterium]|nr:hypothetical protein [Verrucomicrobiota bacterium]HNU51897.1 hypothetical protein [Verrucomicrobiota bacterium]
MNPKPQDPNGDKPCRAPLRLWWVPVAMAALRAIPFLMTRVLTPPPGITLPAVGYNPIDTFAYVAFIRQAAETGVWMFDNPYATQVQDGRFLLPLFAFLGHVCRWTGLDPFWALELARVPLLFLFVAVLWRFLAPFIPEMNRRLTAVWMVGFAGGIEVLARPLVGLLPAALQNLAHQALSDEQGWNTFAAAYNPLWLAGLTLTMIALRPWLEPPDRQKARDWFQAGLGLVATYWVHPYSGLVVLAVIAMLPLLRWSLGFPIGSPGYRRGAGLCLGAALAALAAVTFWQHQDPVYGASAARALGDNPLSLFWYPVTLGGGDGWRFAAGGPGCNTPPQAGSRSPRGLSPSSPATTHP